MIKLSYIFVPKIDGSSIFTLISPAGEYIFEVRSVANPRVVLRSSEPIKVAPAPMKQSEIGKLFDDLDDMLKFDI
jgi:hypothetical protein